MTKINEVFIENWAMSCRVLERGMENFIINYLQEFCKSQNINVVTSEYLESPKNSLVKDLYEKVGFKYKASTDLSGTID